jgi:hypothetical protein
MPRKAVAQLCRHRRDPNVTNVSAGIAFREQMDAIVQRFRPTWKTRSDRVGGHIRQALTAFRRRLESRLCAVPVM